MVNTKSILFICPYPVGQSPSQRFRFEQYFDLLHANGFSIKEKPFITLSVWHILYQRGNLLRKAIGVINGFINRIILLGGVHQFDFVFIHRESTPVGPPWFEWMITKIWKKKIIYDFDDAIWLPNTSEDNRLAAQIKWHSKIKSICRWSYKISCGNQYLSDFAKEFNNNVFLNPTTIDTANHHNRDLYPPKIKSDQFTIGWTGTHSTLKYLDAIVPVIQSLEKEFPDQIRFIVIADKNPNLVLKSFVFIQWSKESEIQDLLQFDIGLMPLSNDIWAKGKCGFKALQYMALSIPVLASPVGVNVDIIDQNVDGYLCNTEEEWKHCIEMLLTNSNLRKKIGEKGRKKIIENYSVSSNGSNFLSLFE